MLNSCLIASLRACRLLQLSKMSTSGPTSRSFENGKHYVRTLPISISSDQRLRSAMIHRSMLCLSLLDLLLCFTMTGCGGPSPLVM